MTRNASETSDADEFAAILVRITGDAGGEDIRLWLRVGLRIGLVEKLGETTDDDWDTVVDDMLGATFRACRAVVPSMRAGGFGRIVNIAARSGLVGVSRSVHYAAAKAGIVGLTRSLAKECGPDGILVNAIAPVLIQTEKDGKPTIPPEREEEAAKRTPLRRIAKPEDVAAVTVWLGSAANTYVTGEVISLHGGDQR